MKKKWFKSDKRTGWKKTQCNETRRRKLLDASDRRYKLRKRFVWAGKKALALSNITRDATTRRLAKSDYIYFFAKAKQKKK